MDIHDGSGTGRLIDDEDLPKVISAYDLRGLDKNGRKCESCGKHMHAHDWALLDINGFVLYCSVTDWQRTLDIANGH